MAPGVDVDVAAQDRGDPADAIVQCIRKQLRIVQNLTGCSEKTLNLVLEKLQPFLKGCEKVKNLKMCRVRARQQSTVKKQLHGCVHCSEHVFAPECRLQRCPKCGGRRFNAKGKPHEVDFSRVY